MAKAVVDIRSVLLYNHTILPEHYRAVFNNNHMQVKEADTNIYKRISTNIGKQTEAAEQEITACRWLEALLADGNKILATYGEKTTERKDVDKWMTKNVTIRFSDGDEHVVRLDGYRETGTGRGVALIDEHSPITSINCIELDGQEVLLFHIQTNMTYLRGSNQNTTDLEELSFMRDVIQSISYMLPGRQIPEPAE